MGRLILIVLTAVLLTACKTVEYVPMETVRCETQERLVEVHDSVYIHDSTVIRTKGDTVFETRWKYIYRDRLKHDTAYVHRTDSIHVPYPVERQLTKWERLKVDHADWIILVLLILLTCIIFLYRLRKT